jgi:hypothetical protein
MTFDYLVYGRGITREDGFSLRTGPAYITSDLLLYCGDFQALGDEKILPGAAGNPWADTWMFLCAPPPRCCLLLRVTRAEGDAPGTWLQEVRQKDVWSLEGFCAPFEQKEVFFAAIPSLLWWMHEEGMSLYNRDRSRSLPNPAELPAKYFLNPYSDEPLPEALPPALRSLCQHIKAAPQPFDFLYGAAAQAFAEKIGGTYKIHQVFDANSALPEAPGDLFEAMRLTALSPEAAQSEQFDLRLQIRAEQHVRSWACGTLQSAPTDCDAQGGIEIAQLYAESAAACDFAARMQWNVASQFRFTREV